MPPKNQSRQKKSHIVIRSIGKSFLKVLIKILYRPVYHNLERIPQNKAYMIASNHSSNLDPVVISMGFSDWVNWVGKKELFEFAPMRWFMNVCGVIPLDRSGTDLKAAKQIMQCMKNGEVVGIFPQGKRVTKNNYQQIQPQKGVVNFALRYKMPILPVATGSPYKLFRKNHIYIGTAYELENYDVKHNKEKHLEETIRLMGKIYHLIGFPYQIENKVKVES